MQALVLFESATPFLVPDLFVLWQTYGIVQREGHVEYTTFVLEVQEDGPAYVAGLRPGERDLTAMLIGQFDYNPGLLWIRIGSNPRLQQLSCVMDESSP